MSGRTLSAVATCAARMSQPCVPCNAAGCRRLGSTLPPLCTCHSACILTPCLPAPMPCIRAGSLPSTWLVSSAVLPPPQLVHCSLTAATQFVALPAFSFRSSAPAHTPFVRHCRHQAVCWARSGRHAAHRVHQRQERRPGGPPPADRPLPEPGPGASGACVCLCLYVQVRWPVFNGGQLCGCPGRLDHLACGCRRYLLYQVCWLCRYSRLCGLLPATSWRALTLPLWHVLFIVPLILPACLL